MDIIINILFVSGLSLLLTRATPIIYIKRYIGLEEERYDDWSNIRKFLYELSSCMWCISFWIGLILYGFKIAVISSLISFLIDENM